MDSVTIDHEPGTDFALISRAVLPTVLAADKDDLLGKLQASLRARKLDASTPKGREEIRSAAAEVARTKSALLKLADGVSEEARKTHKAIVAEKHVLEEKLDALRDSVRAPLTEYEQIEKNRCDGHEKAIAAIKSAGEIPPGATSAELTGMLATFDAWGIFDRDWKEFHPRATEARTNARNALVAARALAEIHEARAAKAAEETAAEAERQRVEAARLQAEREARIAEEAAQRAREEAEARAAKDAADAAAKAEAERHAAARREREALEAAAQAHREAEAAEKRRLAEAEQAARDRAAAEQAAAQRQAEAVAAERDRAAAEAEAKRKADEARAANVAHRKRINNEALQDICRTANLTTEVGQAVIAAIVKGEVTHVRISY